MHVYLDGPFRVILSLDGEVLAVQDRISGCAASLRYAPASVLAVSRRAQDAWQSIYSD